ncbi:Wzz/FepE/Etk N-terminal domain-containing protein [Dyadobacter psychrotolerans]|uniref:Polysaccharide chain length determinant N-terminal domain-containing protein n=1 Tax=Dyadobacter psychrotolerans TaxID=2541721 RepID=A0A4R5DMC5_9BACT|nr:Wzz/FepE/Etk N-terminal domain-containing protein [Dyadobacter psychrotolerans]TDE13141.1 hypothetical protein E0F88_18960 [Dyadobacter psychrotolerans]
MSEFATINKESLTIPNNEIRLKDLITFIKRNLLLLIAVSAVSAILGVAFSFSLPKMYNSQIILLPEYGALKKNSLSSLLNTNMLRDGVEKLAPELYPTILKSSLLGIYLLQQPVIDQDNKSYKSLDIFLQQTIKPGLLSGVFSSNTQEKIVIPPKIPGAISYSRAEERKIKSALALINSEIDIKNGVLTVTASTEDPIVSAIVVEASKTFLINYVEEYRTDKATQEVQMLSGQVTSSRRRLRNTELALQSYRDRNRNPFLNVARIEEQRLQSDYVLAESLYSDLVRRYEQAKIKVNEEKPVFKVIEPAKISLNKSSPKRLRIGIISGFLGAFICLLYIIFIKEKLFRQTFSPNLR